MTLFDNLGFKKRTPLVKQIIAAIEQGYEAKRREIGIMDKNSFSPSSIGYKHNRCPRLWAMKFAGRYEEQHTGDLLSVARMDHGTNAHERIQAALQEAGIVEHLEYEIKNEDPPIRGFIDAILNVDGKRTILEIKTTRTEAFQWRAIRMNGPSYHMYQILLYMYLMDIDNGILLYENTNDKQLAAVPVEMTDENRQIIEEALQWMREVWALSQEGKLPSRPWKRESPNCKDCPLFNECWDNEPREDGKFRTMRVHNW